MDHKNSMKPHSLDFNSYSKIRARPLTLKEVLQLRDGIKFSRTQPYQIQKIANYKKILLALN